MTNSQSNCQHDKSRNGCEIINKNTNRRYRICMSNRCIEFISK